MLKCHKHLCADYLTKYYILSILKNKNFLEPKLNYINFIKNPVCLEEKNFIIYPTIKYENQKYDLLKIYPKEILINNTIKIIHQNNENIKNKFLCVFGVLENENGLAIEKEMNEWLLPEYNVYTVYQKYPGKLFEYPALRFAQWLLKKKNDINFYYIFIQKEPFIQPKDKEEFENVGKMNIQEKENLNI